MQTLFNLWQHLQGRLFPLLTEEIGPLGEKDREFVRVIGLLPLDRFIKEYEWCGKGRPPSERVWLFHAFIAKKVYQFANTEVLWEAIQANAKLRQLCGWEATDLVPSYTTFTRAFAQFAQTELAQRIHEALIQKHCGGKLVGHVSRDSTAIGVPESPAPKAPKVVGPKGKAGRLKQGQVRAPKTRLERQELRTLAENLHDLPRGCDFGCKTDSQGFKTWWRGYKLHLDVIDGDIPVSAVLTSASLHDSQVAIPLTQMTSGRVTSLYDLMDGAYDSKIIADFSRKAGHVPIIEPKKQAGYVPLDPAQRRRFAERTACERVNSRLKEQFGGRTVRVHGATKVMADLMLGVLVLAALGIWRRLC